MKFDLKYVRIAMLFFTFILIVFNVHDFLIYMYQVILLVVPLLAVWVYMQIIYLHFLSLFGFKKAKRDYDIINDQTSFLILIPAHNEENVLRATIQNIKKLKYNSNLFSIVVVNDNSVDGTGKIALDEDVKLIQTDLQKFPKEGFGKSAGLQYALRELGFEELINKFDLIMILDADNFVDENLLTELNSQWVGKNKPVAIQSYLDSKNINKLLPLGYAVSYWMMGRFFQLAKYRLGLPNSIGGTGFVVRTDWLISTGGFNYDSLTEDLEMGIRIIEQGHRVIWNHFAKVYDEKPENLINSMVQRYRWSKGHWSVAMKKIPNLWKLFLTTGKYKYIDQISYLLSMRQSFQILIIIFIFFFSIFLWLLPNFNQKFEIVNTIIGVLKAYIIPVSYLNFFLLIYTPIFLPLYGMKKDGLTKKYSKGLVALWYFSLTYIPAQIVGLFNYRSQQVWLHTKHVKSKLEIDNKID